MRINRYRKIIAFLLAVFVIVNIMQANALAAQKMSSEGERITNTGDTQVKWSFSTFGAGTDTKNNGYIGNVNDGHVTVYSENNMGKLVLASTDGLSFYYTAVPSDMNFTLRAKVTVDSWKLSNGQEGFGLMAADRVAENGMRDIYWNNSYMASATRVEYRYDTKKNEVTASSSGKYILMRLGICSQEKTGVTPENLALLEANDTEAVNTYFKSSMYTLETSGGRSAANKKTVYTNIIANGTVSTNDGDVVVAGTSPNAVTQMYLTIQKNNTGYFVSYEDMSGNITTKKYYDTEALEHLDRDNVYVGFFASRNARATFTDITFTTVTPEEDAAAEERPIEKIPVDAAVKSVTSKGTSDYEFLFLANCDGKLTIMDSSGNVLVKDAEVKANTTAKPVQVTLSEGKNRYKLIFTPDKDYIPGEYQKMESYEPIEISHIVNYKTYDSESGYIWVSPHGSSSGIGTKESPTDIFEAVKYVQPGQTIIIMEGTYLLNQSVNIRRGIDGTADKKIYMLADPAAQTRPVFDFQELYTGMYMAGDYWVYKGFDVTRGTNGIRVTGDYNLLEDINSYYNCNTGIQISRNSEADKFEDWPSYNTVLNCTSYGNADEGYEDADGFAAKLTCGVGNVFDGCIAHHNADDGWDLFAKVELGTIGAVTIKNSVAYANGYLEDGTNAGNGNGFKLGGESISGRHVLENCIAYDNKAKGIDSNSCPDVIVRNSISFNNNASNVALYTKNAVNTDYCVDGVISFRNKGLNIAEMIRPVGSQDTSKIYKESNYFWDTKAKAAVNTEGEKASADWFVSLDTSVVPARNENGTINMHGLLELTDKAPISGGNTGSGQDKPEFTGMVTEDDGKKYWYENGLRQGTEGRGKEIYDPESDAWYWLDAVQNGAVATSKDVYQESSGGKWVRYDKEGHMIKGWDKTEAGTYYFDLITGAMAKGVVEISGVSYRFDEVTGILLDKTFIVEDGRRYWYENGILQGTKGRGKEIYDPASHAWYWLDAVQNGAVATSKDVYQESSGGKWVRYDEEGHMIKGWNTTSSGTYYFDLITGAMKKGVYFDSNGKYYYFDEITGILVI